MRRNNLIAYAQSFASFLLDSDIGDKIKNIILFGSVAKNEFDKESDIDIFIDTELERKEIATQLKLFEMSAINKIWLEKGIKNSISLKIGNLEEYGLRRSIISSGVQLYGKFKQMPKNVQYYLLFILNFSRLKRNEKVRLWRKLYGYTQRVGKKRYNITGIFKDINANRIEKNVIMIPVENKEKIIGFLEKNKIDYKFYETWTEKI